MGYARHVAYMREQRNAHRLLVGKPKGKNHLEDLGIDGRIILNYILKKYDRRIQTGYVWHSTETSGGLLQHGNGPSGSIMCEKFLD
jgi:hypothetical protein